MSVIEENWDLQLDIVTIDFNSFNELELKIQFLHRHLLDSLENGFKSQKFNLNGIKSEDNNNELKALTELNKQLRLDIEDKVGALSKQKVQYESYKKDQKLLSQEIKETHEAFLMAKKYYKKFLKMYYTIESRNDEIQTIFVQFFTESKKESENYSIRLIKETKNGSYQLVSVTPELHLFKEVRKQLEDTKDVPGALCCIRQAFLNMKKNKK